MILLTTDKRINVTKNGMSITVGASKPIFSNKFLTGVITHSVTVKRKSPNLESDNWGNHEITALKKSINMRISRKRLTVAIRHDSTRTSITF